MARKNLTKKQRDFVEHYLTCFNAYESAKVAGYSDNVASKTSYKMLENPLIQEEIKKRTEEMREYNPAIANSNEVLAFLSKVMRGEVEDERLVNSGDRGWESVMIQTRTESRIKAAELLGKANALFTERQEVAGVIQQVVFEGEDELED